MKKEVVDVLENCALGSVQGRLTFPTILASLEAVGVERYHADYCRHEITYYLQTGESHVVELGGTHGDPADIGREFNQSDVADAVKKSQRQEHSYLDFVAMTMKAGCVGYFVQLSGRQVQYFGRKGEIYTELFP